MSASLSLLDNHNIPLQGECPVRQLGALRGGTSEKGQGGVIGHHHDLSPEQPEVRLPQPRNHCKCLPLYIQPPRLCRREAVACVGDRSLGAIIHALSETHSSRKRRCIRIQPKLSTSIGCSEGGGFRERCFESLKRVFSPR